jgi:hypothetical protein
MDRRGFLKNGLHMLLTLPVGIMVLSGDTQEEYNPINIEQAELYKDYSVDQFNAIVDAVNALQELHR